MFLKGALVEISRLSVIAVLLGSSGTAFAQTAEQAAPVDDGGIVVVAQKREQSVQSVGITMSVLSGSDLASKGLSDATQLTTAMPNIQVNYGAGQTAFNVRGIGVNEFASNFDSPIAVHVDEIYVPRTYALTTLLFDVNHVEALKGPQGTLFGRNATGGAINFYTNDPAPKFGVGGNIGFDTYQTLKAEAYVNAPLTDTLALRVAGFVADQGRGFAENVTLGRRDGAVKKMGFRGKLLWDDGTTRALLTISYGRDRSTLIPYSNFGVITPESYADGTNVFCQEYLNGTVNGATPNCVRAPDGLNPGGTNPYRTTNNLQYKLKNDTFGASLRLEHDLGGALLTSISSYQYSKRDQVEDSDSGPLDSRALYYHATSRAFIQEVRLTSQKASIWNYVIGAFYEHENFTSGDYFAGNSGALTLIYSPFGTKLDAFALFMNNDIKVTDELSIVAGVRYANERISLSGGTFLASGLANGYPTTILEPALSDAALVPAGRNPNKSTGTTFKIGVTYEPHLNIAAVDHLMLYANISTGFRSGSFNADFATAQESITALNPERITAYEAGFKSTLFDRRLTLNGAIFHYKFEDGFINVDVPGTIIPVTVNAANIGLTGIEMEGRLKLFRGLSLHGGFGWLDAAIESDITSANVSLKGDRPVNAPEWTHNVGADFTTDLGSDLQFSISGDANYRSSQYMEAVNGPANLEPGYWLVNARASIGPKGGAWQASVWVNNLTKTIYRTYINDLPALGYVVNTYGNPRTAGVTLSFKY